MRVLVFAIYAYHKFSRSCETNFELLERSTFKSVIPREMLDKLHSIRKTGNDALYPGAPPVTQKAALSRLKDAYDLGKWWAVLTPKAKVESISAFREPPVQSSLPPEVRKKLAEQDLLLEKTVAELENVRKQYHEVTQKDSQLKAFRREGQESADLVRLMPDEQGIERGVRLFSYLAQEANLGKADRGSIRLF